MSSVVLFFFFFQAEDGIRDYKVTGVQTCALPISQARQRGQAGALGLEPGRRARAGVGTARRARRQVQAVGGSRRAVSERLARLTTFLRRADPAAYSKATQML